MSNKIILTFQSSNKGAGFLDQKSRIKYVDDHMIPHVFSPGLFGQYKHVVSTSRDYIDIAYQDKTVMTRHFLFKNGDSVFIKLDKKWPVAKILNRQASTYESNFEKNMQQHLYNNKASALEEYYYYWRMANNGIIPLTGSIISEELHFLKEKASREIQEESLYIDSVLKFEKIDREITDFYQLKNAFIQDKLKLFDDDKINFSNTQLVESIVSKINDASTDSVKPMSIYTFHDDFITTYYQADLSKQIDNKTDLDSITELEYYSTAFGKSLLFKHVDRLLFSSSVKQGKELLESFDSDILLDYWSNYFYSKYNLDQNFDTHWSISNNQKNTLRFENLLLQKQGNLLYVDFWASWCLRSIREAPALEKLHKDYETRGVHIVHISVDTELEKWKWAENKYLGFNQLNSYVLQNIDLATVSETFALDSIPRYLLFDQQGNLIHGNAPKPSSEEIRILFDTNLDKTRIKDSIL